MKKKIFENISALTILQLLNYILPFVTLPYLVRILGIDNYGAYLFSQALITYFIIFVDFGFDLYATRLISINRNNKNYMGEILSTILWWKVIFIFISFMILTFLIIFVPIFYEFRYLHYSNFLMIIGTSIFFNFYYQGLEKMKYITILNAGAKIFFTVLIFVIINDPEDLIMVGILNSAGYIIMGIFSFFNIFVLDKVPLRNISLIKKINHLKNSFGFFISRVAVSTYTVSNTIIIGLILGNSYAGIYGSADKIFRGIMSLYTPINNVFYPFIAHYKNIELYKKIMKYTIISNIFVAIILFIFSNQIVEIVFGDELIESANILRLFCIALIYVLPHVLIGYPLLGGMGYTKEVNSSVIFASIFHVITLILIIPILNIYLVAVLALITEFIILVIRLYYVKKYNLLR